MTCVDFIDNPTSKKHLTSCNVFRSDLPQAHAVLKISRTVDENEHLMVKHSCLLRNFDDPFTQVQYLRISSDM